MEGVRSNERWLGLGWEWGRNKKKKKPNKKFLKSPITLAWFNYLWGLFFSWGFIHTLVMNSNGEGMEGPVVPARCCRDARTRRWDGDGQSPSCRGDTRDPGRGQGPRRLRGAQEQESDTKQRGVGDGGEWPEKLQEGEEAKERNCEGRCHSQTLILISGMQSLGKILSDLCQIL